MEIAPLFYLEDSEVLNLSKFETTPKQLIWSWENWKQITHAELMGNPLSESQETIIELTARYMEFILGNLNVNLEIKTYPLSLMPGRLSASNAVSKRKMPLIRDRLLNELSLYGETRSAFRRLLQS